MKEKFTKKYQNKTFRQKMLFFSFQILESKRTSSSFKNEFVFFSFFKGFFGWIHTQIQIHNAGLDLFKDPFMEH
jgi:hypothetical protein